MANNSFILTNSMNLPTMLKKSFQWHHNWMKSWNDSVIPSPVRIPPWSSVIAFLFRQESDPISLLVCHWRSLLSPDRQLRSLEDQSYSYQKTFNPPYYLHDFRAFWIRKIHHQNEAILFNQPKQYNPHRHSPNLHRSDNWMVWKIAWKHHQ
jgi:hypothetical protein